MGIVCREATSAQLLSRLATHELDVVLSDVPVDPSLNIRAYSHLLGECGTLFVAVTKQAALYSGTSPSASTALPYLPTDNTALRRALDYLV